MRPLPSGAFNLEQDFVDFLETESKYRESTEVPQYSYLVRNQRKYGEMELRPPSDLRDLDEFSEAECDRERLRYQASSHSEYKDV